MSDQNNSRKPIQNNQTDAFSTDNSSYAVALEYDSQKHNAPIVTAKGQGEIAQKIIRLALDNNIEIRQDADLVQILRAVDINEEIPIEAFAAVAEIISYIYQQNNKAL